MKLLISGGAGFIGSHVADSATNLGLTPTIIDNLSTGRLSNISDRVFFPGQMNISDTPAEFFDETTTVIHLAAIPKCNSSLYTPEQDATDNYIEGIKFLKKCFTAKVKRIVLVSSMSVYGTSNKVPFSEDMKPDPIDPYAINKWALEKVGLALSKASGVEYVILRPQNVFGPRQRGDLSYRNVIARWIKNLLNDRPLPVIGTLDLARCFSPVSLVTRGIMAAVFAPGISGEVFNLGTSRTRTLREIATLLEKVSGRSARFRILPSPPTLPLAAYGSTKKAEGLGVFEETTEFEVNLANLYAEIKESGYSSPEEVLAPELFGAEFYQIYKSDYPEKNMTEIATNQPINTNAAPITDPFKY
jgi:nucleoside-diphosphate-sugar epimerase